MRESANRTSTAIVTITLVAACLFRVSPLLGQHTTRDLVGTVTDGHREPLKGAVVQVHNENTGSIASYVTSRNGRYSFKRLDGETDYQITASYQGHQSRSKTLSSFSTKQLSTINLKVKNR